MVFETLYESAQRGELLLIDGGMCFVFTAAYASSTIILMVIVK